MTTLNYLIVGLIRRLKAKPYHNAIMSFRLVGNLSLRKIPDLPKAFGIAGMTIIRFYI